MERVDMITTCLREKKKIDAHRTESRCRISPLRRLVIGLMLVGGFPVQHCYAQISSSTSERQVPVTSPESADKEQLRIGAGDLVDVEIFNTPELSAPKLRVDQFGNITLPAIGHPVMIAGLSTSAAAAQIREQLQAAEIMPDPQVTVFIVEYATQGITVLGEVRAPGTYTLLGRHSLYDALSAAGGPTPTEGASIVITRANDPSHPLTIDVKSANYSELQKATIVYPGDTIVVSRAELVYVVGDVVRSGAYYMQYGRPLTVLELMSLAAGINRTAKMSKCSVVRKVPDGVEIIRFDLGKVMQSKLANFPLLAGDVVVVPRSGLKDFGVTALPGLTTAVVSATVAALIVQ